MARLKLHSACGNNAVSIWLSGRIRDGAIETYPECVSLTHSVSVGLSGRIRDGAIETVAMNIRFISFSFPVLRLSGRIRDGAIETYSSVPSLMRRFNSWLSGRIRDGAIETSMRCCILSQKSLQGCPAGFAMARLKPSSIFRAAMISSSGCPAGFAMARLKREKRIQNAGVQDLGCPAGFAMARLKRRLANAISLFSAGRRGCPAGFAMARLKQLSSVVKYQPSPGWLSGRIRDGAIETKDMFRIIREKEEIWLSGRIRDGAIETAIGPFTEIEWKSFGCPAGFAMARLKRLGERALKVLDALLGCPAGFAMARLKP